MKFSSKKRQRQLLSSSLKAGWLLQPSYSHTYLYKYQIIYLYIYISTKAIFQRFTLVIAPCFKVPHQRLKQMSHNSSAPSLYCKLWKLDVVKWKAMSTRELCWDCNIYWSHVMLGTSWAPGSLVKFKDPNIYFGTQIQNWRIHFEILWLTMWYWMLFDADCDISFLFDQFITETLSVCCSQRINTWMQVVSVGQSTTHPSMTQYVGRKKRVQHRLNIEAKKWLAQLVLPKKKKTKKLQDNSIRT